MRECERGYERMYQKNRDKMKKWPSKYRKCSKQKVTNKSEKSKTLK